MSSETIRTADFFDKISDRYERLTGGCTREIAQFLLTQPPAVDSSSIVLDNACGTGIITKDTLDKFPASSPGQRPTFYAVDISLPMVNNLNDVARAKGWINGSDGLVHSSAMDAQELTFPDNLFTHSYTNFGIFFVPNPEKAAGHIYRTLKPGGRAYVTSWAKLGYLPILREATKDIGPEEKPFTLPFSDDWFHEEKLRQVLEAGGFESSKVKIQRKTAFYRGNGLDDLIDIMKSSFGELVTKEWTEEKKERWAQLLREKLTDKQKKEARLEMEAFVATAEK